MIANLMRQQNIGKMKVYQQTTSTYFVSNQSNDKIVVPQIVNTQFGILEKIFPSSQNICALILKSFSEFIVEVNFVNCT